MVITARIKNGINTYDKTFGHNTNRIVTANVVRNVKGTAACAMALRE